MAARLLVGAGLLPAALLAQPASPPPTLPAPAVTRLQESLTRAERHRAHIWRDTPPVNDDGTVNVFVEISAGDLRKWEFDMATNRAVVDRTMPRTVGGYPINYGFVPQTISYDGDPFDGLVLGPPLRTGTIVRGVVVGLMHMDDEKGHDSKVVVSPAGPGGRALYKITDRLASHVGGYFSRYKQHEPGAFSHVPGWADAALGLEYVKTAHAFFRECRGRTGAACEVAR